MHITFQGMQIFVTLLLLIEFSATAHASEPITFVYGRGRTQLMNLTMNGQSQLEKAISKGHSGAWTQ